MAFTEDGKELFFIWLDEDGHRCSPRHETMKAALNYQKGWRDDPRREEGYGSGRSNKEPKELKMGLIEYVDLDGEMEKAKKDLERLQAMGVI